VDELPLRTRAKDYELDLLLAEGDRLIGQMQDILAKIREQVRAHQDKEPDERED
jgi:hypothetical protein